MTYEVIIVKHKHVKLFLSFEGAPQVIGIITRGVLSVMVNLCLFCLWRYGCSKSKNILVLALVLVLLLSSWEPESKKKLFRRIRGGVDVILALILVLLLSSWEAELFRGVTGFSIWSDSGAASFGFKPRVLLLSSRGFSCFQAEGSLAFKLRTRTKNRYGGRGVLALVNEEYTMNTVKVITSNQRTPENHHCSFLK